MLDKKFLNPAFITLLSAFLAESSPVYIVGGAVRDLLLAQNPHWNWNTDKRFSEKRINDLDIVLHGPILARTRRVADQTGWAYYPLDTARDIARLVFGQNRTIPLVCDVSQMHGTDIQADLASRDFTINAMALAVDQNLYTQLLDYHNGETDLQNRLLRCVSPVSLAEDAVRLLRAVRFSVEFDLHLDQQTRTQIERLARTIRLTSVERIRDELWKMLVSEAPSTAIEEMDELGLLPYVLPEITALHGVKYPSSDATDTFHHMLAAAVQLCTIKDWIFGREERHRDSTQAQQAAWAIAQTRLQPHQHRLRQALATPVAVGHPRIDWMIFHLLFQNAGLAKSGGHEAQATDHEIPSPVGEHSATIGAELAANRLTQLRFSRHEILLVQTVVQNQWRPDVLHQRFATEPISRRACYRYFREIDGKQYGTIPFNASPGIDILLLSLANRLATVHELPPTGEAYLNEHLNHIVQLLSFIFDDEKYLSVNECPLVNGHQLMQHFDLPPGKQVGRILEQLREAQVVGEIATPQEAFQVASRLLREDNS